MPSVAPPAVKRKLKLSQRVFVEALTNPDDPKTFLNAKQSYLAAHPGVTTRTAEVNGSLQLRKTEVADAVEDELLRGGLTKEKLEHELSKNIQKCWSLNKLETHQSGVLGLAKLAGYLIDKQEVKTLTDQQQDAVRRLVVDSLQTPN